MIAGIGLPYAYDHFGEDDGAHPQGPPFVCFMYPTSDNFGADNMSYARVTQLVIELYTDAPDFDMEDTVADILDANELPYTRDQTYIEGERMYQTTYTTEVLLHPDPEPEPEPGPTPEPDPDPDDNDNEVIDNGE